MPTTSLRIITIVVVAIAFLAAIGVTTLAWCLIMGIHADQVLTTAFVGITTGLTGTLSGLLINTRSHNDGDDAVPPLPVEVQNKASHPVPIKPNAKT